MPQKSILFLNIISIISNNRKMHGSTPISLTFKRWKNSLPLFSYSHAFCVPQNSFRNSISATIETLKICMRQINRICVDRIFLVRVLIVTTPPYRPTTAINYKNEEGEVEMLSAHVHRAKNLITPTHRKFGFYFCALTIIIGISAARTIVN